jgi:F5/8 type C domain
MRSLKPIFIFLMILLVVPPLLGQQPPQPLMVDPAIDAEGPFSYLSHPNVSLAVPAAKRGAQVTYDGALLVSNGEIFFATGTPLSPMMARQKTWLDGWIPIIQYGTQNEGLDYQVEAFVNTLDGTPESLSVLFIQVTVANNTTERAYGSLAVASRQSGMAGRYSQYLERTFSPDWIYDLSDQQLSCNGFLRFFYPTGADVEAVPGVPFSEEFQGRDFQILEQSTAGLVRFSPSLDPGEKETYVFKAPVTDLQISNTELLEQVKNVSYTEYRQKTIDLWNGFLENKSELYVSETKVMEAHLANIMYALQGIHQNFGPNQWVQGVNKFQYCGFWLRDGAYLLRNYEVWGMNNLAKRLLELYPKYHKKSGLFQSQEGQLDGFGQALFALGAHAIINGDEQYAESIWPYFTPAINWLIQARLDDEKKLMPPTHVMDNEFINGRYTGHNFWALLGLRTAIRIANMTNHPDEAKEWEAEYNLYSQHLKDVLKEVAGEGGALPPGIDVEGGQDWGNMIGVFPAEVLSPFDPHISATLDKVHEEKFAEGIMTYKGELHHYLTVMATQNNVFRDEQEKALRDFYAILLHMGSTHEMFEWQTPAWGPRAVGDNFAPHGWGSAMFNLLLRNMLVNERGGAGGTQGREIHLCSVLSPQWVRPGEKLILKDAPTEIGPLSMEYQFHQDGAELILDTHFRTDPLKLVLHLPYFVELESASANNTPLTVENGSLTLPVNTTSVSLKWQWLEKTTPFSFSRSVTEYKEEYARRYNDYIKNGGKPLPVSAPPFLSQKERSLEFNELFGAMDPGIAVGKPVLISGIIDPGHPPEMAVDGNSQNRDGSSWWVSPPAPQWLQVDLEKITDIASIRAIPYWDGSRYYQYVIDVSTDQENWTRVADMTTNRLAGTGAGYLHEFNSTPAQYIRITMLSNSANTSLHLVEVKVYEAKNP